MIFIFIFCIIAIIAFIFLLFLCFKPEKVSKILSIYMASPNNAAATINNPTRHRSDIFVYLLSFVCLMLLLYVILRAIFRCYKHFHQYHMTTYFFGAHGHDKGPSTAIAIELSNLSEIIDVNIAHVNIPITLFSVHNTDHHDYHVVSGNWFYDFLKISRPIILLHRNGIIPM